MIAEPAHRVGRPRPEAVRRLVGYRLPVGSLVVDVAGPGEPVLHVFTDGYRTLAVTPRGVTGSGPRTPTVWGDPIRLPLAGASVDCVLLLDAATSPRSPSPASPDANRVPVRFGAPGGAPNLTRTVWWEPPG